MLSIASFNVNGLKGFTPKRLLAAAQQLGGPTALDILCLQETKLSVSPAGNELKQLMVQTFDSEGYECFFNTCTARNGYSGTAALVRRGMVREASDWFPDDPDNVHDASCALCDELKKEGRVLILDIVSAIVINVYVPNGGKEASKDVPLKTEFLRRLRLACDYFNSQNRRIILVGDLNLITSSLDIFYPLSDFEQIIARGEPCMSKSLQLWFAELQNTRGLKDTFRELHPQKRSYSWWDYKTQVLVFRENDSSVFSKKIIELIGSRKRLRMAIRLHFVRHFIRFEK